MSWKIEKRVEDDGYDYRTTLVITDSSGVREYSDGGEPEDNTFTRDWKWVAIELEKAYQEGLIGRSELEDILDPKEKRRNER